jgi:CubicO group peptidase (beta-lactamase class C family)
MDLRCLRAREGDEALAGQLAGVDGGAARERVPRRQEHDGRLGPRQPAPQRGRALAADQGDVDLARLQCFELRRRGELAQPQDHAGVLRAKPPDHRRQEQERRGHDVPDPERSLASSRHDPRALDGPLHLAEDAVGGFESSIADLARWAAALDRGVLLGREGYRAMFTPGRLSDGRPIAFGFRDDPVASYGLGWFLTRHRGRVEQSHGGAVAGFSSMIIRLPESWTTVIVLSNGKDRGDRRAQAELIARAALDVLLGPGGAAPVRP